MNENMEKICRTCLSTENELLLITSEIEDNYRIIDYFNECLNIKMNENDTDDNLPKTICLMCLDNLLEVRKFYKKCVESEKYLKHQKNNKIIIKEENLDIEKVPINNANTDNDRDDGGGDEEFTDYEMLEASTNNTLVDSVIDNRKQNKLIVGFSCIECNEDFKYEKNYRLHLKIDHGINEFVIQDELYTNNDESVTDATDNATKNVQKSNSTSVVKNYKCEICDYAFSFENNYRYHMKRHILSVNDDDMVIKKELLKFVDKDGMERERGGELKIQQIKCNICDRKFCTENAVKRHYVAIHCNRDNDDVIYCHKCGGLQLTEEDLKNHLKIDHENKPKEKVDKQGRKKYICRFCNRDFFSKDNHSSHERRHTGERPYKCIYCTKSFIQRSTLATHLKLHTGKNVQCPLCDKKFCRQGFLKIHMRSHTDERPYACDYCPLRYTQKCHLQAHIRSIHLLDKPFKCDFCDMSFNRKDALQQHLFVHIGKPYKCPVCSLEFSLLYRFRKHLINVHFIYDDPHIYKREVHYDNKNRNIYSINELPDNIEYDPTNSVEYELFNNTEYDDDDDDNNMIEILNDNIHTFFVEEEIQDK